MKEFAITMLVVVLVVPGLALIGLMAFKVLDEIIHAIFDLWNNYS